LKLVHDAENGRSDAISTRAGTDLHGIGGDEADATGFRDSLFCAFCAAPIPDSGEPCCADYAATFDQSPQAGVPQADGISARAVAASQVPPVHAAPGEPRSEARYSYGSYVLLLGLLVSGLIGLAVALTIQMQGATEAARELAETRRLSEEMIALMKETRREAAEAAVVPQAPAVMIADIPIGEAGAPPQVAAAVAPPQVAPAVAPARVAPEVAPPPVAPAAPATVANADTASNSVAPASLAFFGTGTSLGRLPYSASAAPAPATAATADLAPPRRPVAQRAAKALKNALEKIEPRRPSAVAEVREKAAELAHEPAIAASVSQASQPAEPRSPSAESASELEEPASLPPAVRNVALPPRPPIAGGWMKIERGMSRVEVRRLLGRPRATQSLMSGEFWFYAERSFFGRGWVAFSDGGVIEWLTP
jgi:hypothetical protein